MKRKFSIFILLITFQFACSEADVNSINSTNQVPTINPITQKTVNQRKNKPPDSEISVIYWDVLGHIYHDNEHGKILGSINSGTLIYRTESVSPESIDQIENNQGISSDLLNNFKTANQKPVKLNDEYPLASPIRGFKGNRELGKFYKESKSRDSETKAVVCFSNIGFDDNFSDILIYAEYYRPEKGLIKFYYKINNLDKLLHAPIGADGNPEFANYQIIFVD